MRVIFSLDLTNKKLTLRAMVIRLLYVLEICTLINIRVFRK